METTNNLTHVISVNNKTVNCLINIDLNDDCKNGHEDFSITATFWEIGKRRVDKNFITSGCCHEEILKHYPELKLFVDLHLCDFKGAPIHAVENGYYHLGRLSKNEFIEYFNINSDTYVELKKARHKGHFSDLITDLGIVDIWQSKANEGIKELENLTGKKFKSSAVRSHYKPILDATK